MNKQVEEFVCDGVIWIVERYTTEDGVVVTENYYPKNRS